jgi:hypothetical protein
MKRFSLSLVLVLLLTMLSVVPALARGGPGHIYGIVFIDNNPQDGSWGNEAGVADVPVHFVNGSTRITLYSAWTDNLNTSVSASRSNFPPDQFCTHLNEGHRDYPKGCTGTFGLQPISGWWEVYISVPAGCSYTGKMGGSAANPYIVPTWGIGEEGWLEFPISCEGGPRTPTPGTRAFVRSLSDIGVEGPHPVIPNAR